ncbi:MAG: undecaprenyldiphospho-muramoylpentapeptide beta-N-acetylglucosaminyltransferase [Deltaproteobacteria bacterium]|nr:undecaprenyldiphospho-muramoylpentapeptide beta-N-acetylglucosaminyltransferase [Deltaproteobacteria bacterium]
MNTQREHGARVLIAASGTGGHLFPALFIARAFQRISSSCQVEFIGSGRPLEEKVLGSAGFKIHTISMVGVKRRGIKGLFQALKKLPASFKEIGEIFRDFKPDVVVGVGGYVTFVPITYARIKGIPTWIHEAELKPGMANKVLIRYATRVSAAFAQASFIKRKNVIFTGHPVRENLAEISQGIQPPQAPKKVLIVGGSQGARALDEALPALAGLLNERNLELTHQCRPENVISLSENYAKAGVRAKVVPFIDDMSAAYGWADIVISRAGAGTVMELGVANRPVILVPYPYAQGDHQTANAMTLANSGKALVVKEGGDFQPRLREAISRMLDPQFYHQMKQQPFESRSLHAAEAIAQGCLELVREGSPS